MQYLGMKMSGFLNSPLMRAQTEKQGVLENFSKKLKVELSVLDYLYYL